MGEDGEESRMNVREREREKKECADAMRVKIRDEEGS